MVAAEKDFLWIEGTFDAYASLYAITLEKVRFSVLREVRAGNPMNAVLRLLNSHNNRLDRLLLTNSPSGLSLESSSHNSITRVTASGNGYGIFQKDSHDNFLAGLTLTRVRDSGILQDSSKNNMLSGVLALNNTAGVNLQSTDSATTADVAATHNYKGVTLTRSNNNRFTGRLVLGNSRDQDCTAQLGTNEGLGHLTCEITGRSDAVVTRGASAAGSFVGRVTADAANTADTEGKAAYPAAPERFDWHRFDNPYRAWGREDDTLPHGYWTYGTGRIWDWSLSAADTVARNALPLPTGNDVITHTWSGGGSATFLRRALELDGDGDGLCEANETCLYTPNFGAYQGHGDLVSAGTFENGSLRGVRLLKYATNGR